MADKKKYPSQEIIGLTLQVLLILLFYYTGLSKLLDFDGHRHKMIGQALPNWLVQFNIYALPWIELITATLLCFQKSLHTGLRLATLLMILFTGYIIWVLLGASPFQPCSCGGVLSAMGWKTHLVFNLLFLAAAIYALYLFRRERRPPKK